MSNQDDWGVAFAGMLALVGAIAIATYAVKMFGV
jgi:hypothetical protein